ncbi:MAG: hypothetical protein II816_04585 [Elusimicrobia bacterium]|nr:hypothetical protein [Elusimicrobiota bacterium]
MVLLHYSSWHTGIFFLILIFSCWVFQVENKIDVSIKYNKIFYVLFVLILLFQIYFSLKQSLIDVKENCDASMDVVNIIKENNFDKENIVGINYGAVSVQPYFNKNIFSNMETSYWQFSYKNFDKYLQKTKEQLSKAKIAIVFNLAPAYERINRQIIRSFTKSYAIKSNLYVKGIKSKHSGTYYIFIKD